MRPTRLLTVALAVALSASAAACSSSSDRSSTTVAKTDATDATGSSTTPAGTDAAAGDGSGGCANEVMPGRTERHLTSGGQDRTYVLYVPKGLTTGQPAPLVLDFPAYSPAALEESFSGFTKADATGKVKADEVGAVVVTPEPIGGGGTLRTWNVTDAPGFPDDQQFVTDVLADVGTRTCIDPDRVLAMGFAIGAVMASSVACTHADQITVLATVSGLYDRGECTPSKPVPVIAFHGTADPMLPLQGGIGPNVPMLGLDPATTAGLAGIVEHLKGDQAVAEGWADRNGCAAKPATTTPVPRVTLESWSGCTDDAAVELYVIDGAGHTWPGSNGMDSYVTLLGATSDVIVANDLIWDFFLAHGG